MPSSVRTTPSAIVPIIEPSLEAMGYRLVRVAFTGGRRATLQIMAERLDDAPMTVDDCAEISRSVSALLDVADPIAERLYARGQLARHRPAAGAAARITTASPASRRSIELSAAGRRPQALPRPAARRVDATTMSASIAETARSRCRLPTSPSAKLVLTDELLAATPAQTH